MDHIDRLELELFERLGDPQASEDLGKFLRDVLVRFEIDQDDLESIKLVILDGDEEGCRG